jgi:hypothetical protein
MTRGDDWETYCRASVMFWGCIFYYGVGTLVPAEGNMNTERHISVLDDNLLPVSMHGNMFPSHRGDTNILSSDRLHT